MSKKYGRGRRPVSDPNAFRVSDKTPEGPPVELENQFILRLPGTDLLILGRASL